MSIADTEESEQLRATVRGYLSSRSPEAEVRRVMATEEGYDRRVWDDMATQLGLQGLAVPEKHGGSNASFVQQCIVLEELGARLYCGPFLSTAVTAVHALRSFDDELNGELLARIATGSAVVTLAVTEERRGWTEGSVQLRAEPTNRGWVLRGSKSHVLDGLAADVVLVAARTAAGVSLFAVDGTASGLVRTALPTMDLTRKQANLDFRGAKGRLIGEDGSAWPAVERSLTLTAIAVANESVGAAQAVLDMAVGYAKDRIQFGRPIGSFQAIKHLCADMLLDVEWARSLAHGAAAAVDDRNDSVPLLASLATAFVGDAYWHVASDNIQVHGGIGFTWDHPAHLYLKRAISSRLLLGDPDAHRDRASRLLGYVADLRRD